MKTEEYYIGQQCENSNTLSIKNDSENERREGEEKKEKQNKRK